jgi:hypothetical protein
MKLTGIAYYFVKNLPNLSTLLNNCILLNMRTGIFVLGKYVKCWEKNYICILSRIR